LIHKSLRNFLSCNILCVYVRSCIILHFKNTIVSKCVMLTTLKFGFLMYIVWHDNVCSNIWIHFWASACFNKVTSGVSHQNWQAMPRNCYLYVPSLMDAQSRIQRRTNGRFVIWFFLFSFFFANRTHAYDKPQPHPPSPCEKNVRILKWQNPNALWFIF
jgi:hypothetical protein